MCLAIPGKVITIEQVPGQVRLGKVEMGAIRKNINLELVPEANIGDYVLVHVGVAISVVDEQEALKTLRFLDQMDELDELNPPADLFS